jgi:ribosomal protein S26
MLLGQDPNLAGTLRDIETDCHIRKARKAYRCQARNHKAPDCVGTIQPGTVYVEYMGESYMYSAGYRYCVPCALFERGQLGKPSATFRALVLRKVSA